jgi:hypothetical protein
MAVTLKWIGVVVAATAAVALALPGPASAAARTGPVAAGAARTHWGKPQQVPGLAALSKGRSTGVTAMSCWGLGGCAVAGFYTDSHRHRQVFVAQQRKGRWGKAQPVQGLAALNRGGNAQMSYLSCARTSVCVAVGTYTDKAGNSQWFTVNERNGKWGAAAEVPHPTLQNAVVSTVSCAPGGVCAAGGTFTDPTGSTQAWVQTETNWRWQPALEVPGLAALSSSAPPPWSGPVVESGVGSVLCTSAGDCEAGGFYEIGITGTNDNGFPPTEPFLATETNGTWANAEEVPGIEAINALGWADADAIFMSCPSAGNCSAGGYYQTADLMLCDPPPPRSVGAVPDLPGQPGPPPFGCVGSFVVNQRHRSWGQAQGFNIPYLMSLTCQAAGDCVVTGGVLNFGPTCPPGCGQTEYGVLLTETNGHWGNKVELTSTMSFNSASCASAGYCTSAGTNQAGYGVVISESRGTWGKVMKPAPGAESISAVACPPNVALCTAGGASRGRAFIVSQVR